MESWWYSTVGQYGNGDGGGSGEDYVWGGNDGGEGEVVVVLDHVGYNHILNEYPFIKTISPLINLQISILFLSAPERQPKL